MKCFVKIRGRKRLSSQPSSVELLPDLPVFTVTKFAASRDVSLMQKLCAAD